MKLLEKCPHCESNLKRENIGYSIKGTMLYNLISDGKNLSYDVDEFGDADGGEFFCRSCGKTLTLTEDEVIKILK